MRSLLDSLRSLFSNSSKGQPEDEQPMAGVNEQTIRTFIHEMDKKLLQLDVAYKRWENGGIDRKKFISILDNAITQMREEFMSEAQRSPSLLQQRDQAGELFVEKITRLELLSFNLKNVSEDREKFDRVSTEIKACMDDNKARSDHEPTAAFNTKELIMQKLKNFHGFDEVIEEAIKIVKDERETDFRTKGINIHKVTPGEQLSRILIEDDFVAWRTVVVNMLRNAIDAVLTAMGNINEFDETRKRITVRLDKFEKMLTIEVSDRGCGMDDEAKQKLFESGFSTKGKRGIVGGMGLNADVRQLIERYGSMTFNSQLNIGTTFLIRIMR